MSNRVLKIGDSLVVRFQYHPSLLNVIRSIDGRIFNKPKKQWEVPVTSVIECVDALEKHGFHIDGEVWDLYYETKERIKAIANVKTNPAPYEGKLPLYDFQRTGTAFIRTLPACLLADAPGLGKTLQTAAAFEDTPGPILVLVPASLKFNWQEELAKWVPHERSIVVHGNKKQRTELWHHAHKGRAKWVIANYELLLRDYDDMNQRWEAIVCDEADRITNPFAKTTQRLKQLYAKRRVALTGTPVSNTPEDLWSIADWLTPRMLGTFKQFRERYCVMDSQYQGRVVGYRNLEELRERIEPVMLRRQKEDVLDDFPAKTIEHVRFDLSKDERQSYDALRKLIKSELAEMKDLDTRSLAILPVKMLRLKQATDDLRLIDLVTGQVNPSSKLALLKEMLSGIVKSGEKAIVFTQFSEMAKILQVELLNEGYQPQLIYGDVDAADRQRYVNEFSGTA